MNFLTSAFPMIGLDILMIVYSIWVFSTKKIDKSHFLFAAVLLFWLVILHIGLSAENIFPKDVSGIAFLIIIFIAVAIVGLFLFVIPPVRRMVLGLGQEQLLLMQGIRVFFGATFLMQASIGVLPRDFGILDGFTHIGAGFFGLVAAYSFAAGSNGSRRAWFANLFGLADILVVASTLALVLLVDIGPHHSMMYAVFLPAPLWLWFHVVSIWKLVRVGPKKSYTVESVITTRA